MEFTDIHCHLLPYVDDGASNLDEALELITEEIRQGVVSICFTPHLRKGMFETSDDDVKEQFERIQKIVQDEKLQVNLFLGREYYFNDEFISLIRNKNILPLGNSNVVLTEFSGSVTMNELLEALDLIQSNGYRALFAHVERYKTIREYPESAAMLEKRGALLQINASSILGSETKEQQEAAKRLLKRKLVFAIASDSHRMEFRTPNLLKCSKSLKWKIERDYLEKVLYHNPLSILKLQ